MNDATRRDPGGAVQNAVLTYIQAVEDGDRPDLRTVTSELEPGERAEVEEILTAIGWARSQFPSPLSPTRVIDDRYELRNELGAGGFGKVWRAFDQRLEKDVAIKFVDLLTKSTLEVESLFEAERRALARVDQPGIARILDCGKDEDRLFLVMDLVPGRPLSAVLEELENARSAMGTRPDPDGLRRAIGTTCPTGREDLTADKSWFRVGARIVAEVLRTLEAVHEAGVLHRDIKPSNVMVQGGGHPVLLDFGMASLQDQRRGAVTESLIGTLPYLAPEQLRQHKTGADPRTDVYQVGLLLYEFLTLVPAFDPRATVGLVELVREGAFDRPRRRDAFVPRELEDVCLRALETNPERRYESARAFREDLERWLSGVAAPLASRGGRLSSVWRDARYLVRRNKAVAAATASLAAGVLVAVAVIGGGARVELQECRISTESPDRVVASLESTDEQDVYLLAVLRDEASGDRYYLPLQTTQNDEATGASAFRGRAPAGAGSLELRTPDRQPIASAGFVPERLQVLATREADSSEALARAFQELWQEADAHPESRGVPHATALRLLDALGLPGRGADRVELPAAPERLLDGGTWRYGGVASSGAALGR